jgi:hypothetical protein
MWVVRIDPQVLHGQLWLGLEEHVLGLALPLDIRWDVSTPGVGVLWNFTGPFIADSSVVALGG